MSTRDQQSAPKGARDAVQTADAAPAVGQALQEQIGQALQPAMDVLRDQLTATVRRELEEKLHQPGQISQSAKARSDERPATARTATSERESSRDTSASDETTEARLLDRPELGRALQEQISRAVEPAMAEFREQMSATVQQEVDESLHRDRPRATTEAGRSTNRASEDQEAASDHGADESLDRASSQGSDASGDRAGQAPHSAPGKPLLAALPEILEQQGEHWLRSQLDQGIDLLFSVWVRVAVQQEIERALHRVSRAGIDLVSDGATRDELRAQSEQTVERVVGTALDRLFADEVRDDLKARGHQAIGALLHPEIKSIVQQAQELLLSLLEGLIAVVRECWDQILQFFTRVVLALVQPRLTGILKDTLGSLATTSGRERGKQDAGGSTAANEEQSEPRRASSDHADKEHHEDARERDRSRQRARDDEESEDVGRNGADRRPSRAPSGRPPTGRPSGSRQGSGRSSSDRSASGRPSRAASR